MSSLDRAWLNAAFTWSSRRLTSGSSLPGMSTHSGSCVRPKRAFICSNAAFASLFFGLRTLGEWSKRRPCFQSRPTDAVNDRAVMSQMTCGGSSFRDVNSRNLSLAVPGPVSKSRRRRIRKSGGK